MKRYILAWPRASVCLLMLVIVSLAACSAAPKPGSDDGAATSISVGTSMSGAAAVEAPSTPTEESQVVAYSTAQPTPTPRQATLTPTPLAASASPGSTPAAASTGAAATAVIPPRPENENPLTGLTVDDPASLARRPVHVRIGNDVGARPQVGLNQADMVYEEVVELWVTRFTAIYLSQVPETVAPIRSARLINTQLTEQYQAALSNSGGSDGVRWELSQLPIINLDEYFWPQPYFYRENEGWQTRLALNVKEARALMVREEMETPVLLRGFAFSDEPIGGDPGETIFIPYPKRTSLTEWRYDPESERYLRWVLDEPLLDYVDDSQVSAANVIVYYAEHQETDIVEDTNGATSIRIVINGEGRAQVFRDGVVIEGRWRSDGSQTPEFVFPNGEAIPLKRGNVWVEVVPPDYDVLVDATPEPEE